MSDVASPVSVAPIPTPLSYADPRPAAPAPSLRSRTIKGTIWTTGGYGASQVLRLGVNLVLTRLLQPQMFGLMSLVNIFIQGLQGFSDVGIGPSIIQSKRGDDPVFLNTAWSMQVLRGCTLGAMSALIAWPIAKLYGEDQLVWLLPAAGLGAVIAGFNSTALFTLNRHMEVGKLTLRSLVGQVAGAGVMVAWALLHPSVWALLAGNIAAAVANLAFSYTLVPGQRNWFRWDKSSAQELMKFGRWIFVSTILTFLALQADRLIFGKLITLHDLGIYSVAAMMAALPTTAILKLGGIVVFPAYSRARANGANFQRVFDQVRLPLLAGAGLIAAGMVGGGRQVIELLYDPRYHGAGTMLQLLAVSGWFQVMQVTNGSALLALGSPRSVAAANVVKLLAIVVFVPLGFWKYQLLGGIAGIIAADALKYGASALAASRKGLHMLGKDLVLSLLVAVTGVAAALLAEWVRHRVAGPRVGGVVALLVVGVLVGAVWGPVVYGSLRARKAVS
jgi:O-antigen/teichoic acid export membrane protein